MSMLLPDIQYDLDVKRTARLPLDQLPAFDYEASIQGLPPLGREIEVRGEDSSRLFTFGMAAQIVGSALVTLLFARGDSNVDTSENRKIVRDTVSALASKLITLPEHNSSLTDYDLSVLIEAALIESGAFSVAKALVLQRTPTPPTGGSTSLIRLIRRNGEVVPWNTDKIEVAIRKAFLSKHLDSEPAVGIADRVAGRVRGLGQAYVPIETVQDIVQEELMLGGFMKVAEAYIVYRAQRAILRIQKGATDEQGQQFSLISVQETDGSLSFWDGGDLRQRIQFASIGLDLCLSSGEIEAELRRSLPSEIRRGDLQKTILLNAKSLMERDADFAFFAGRILLSYIYEEVLGWDIARDGVEGLATAHAKAFRAYLEHGVSIRRLSPDLLAYDMEALAKALDPTADLDFDYLGLQTLYDRYLLTDKTGEKNRRIETPQFFWMRVAMGLFKSETVGREEKAVALYHLYKNRRFCSSTPTLFNSGTPHSQLSSCFPGDTPLVTAEGLRRIDSLRPGNKVLTRGGTFESVIAVASKRSLEPLMGLHLDNFLPGEAVIRPTADHRMFALRQEDIVCRRPVNARNATPCLSKRGNLASCHRKPGQYARPCDWRETGSSTQGEWIPAGELRPGDYLALTYPTCEKGHSYRLLDYVDEVRYAEEDERIGRLHQDKKRHYDSPLHSQTTQLPTHVELSPELGRLIGYYLAEGWASEHHISFTFHSAEEDYIQDVASLGRRLFGITPRIHAATKGAWVSVSFHSRILAAFFRKEFGGSGSQKRLPATILEAPRAVVQEVVVGFFRGDGGVVHQHQVAATVSNRSLSHEIALACLKLGALPIWRRAFRNHLAKSDPYSVVLSTLQAPGLIRAIGKDLHKLNWEHSEISIWRIEAQRFFGEGGIAFYRIADIEAQPPSPENVWDIQVENDASFAAMGVVAHNCYLYKVDDSIESIMYRGIAENAFLSKWAGGLGGSWTSVRGTGSYISGTNGESQGVIPFLKMHNDQLVAVNQGGKRAGSGCAYLEVWHNDIFDFLELRKNTGDERRRTHDMNTANWIPDLFMKRMEARQYWTLFRSSETPDLHDLYGKAFEKRYEEYERLSDEGKVSGKKIEAIDLWKQMLKMLFETGHPWITFKDPCNVRSPQDHVGVVHSSNLCTEITLNTSADETAVCNLGSVVLDMHLTPDGGIDHEKLRETIRTAVRALDNVIDINFYPTEAARRSNQRHRPIGLGVMGLQYALYKKGLAFASPEAVEFNDEIMEAVAYYAYEASSDLAAEQGTYSTYKGSKWDRGLLPQDTIDLLEQERGQPIETPRGGKMDWQPLREKIRTHGMRNSNVIAIAPTATIANIMGTSPCIEPIYKNLFVKGNLSGDFVILNPFLVRDLKKEGIWNTYLVEQLKYFDGNLTDIPVVPAAIKERYRTAFQIPTEFVIDAAARRQKWIDQSQSLNLFLPTPDLKVLSHMYRRAWTVGLKTTYYLRTLGASNIEKATVTLKKAVPTEAISVSTETVAAPAPAFTEPVRAFTEAERITCSIDAMRNGEECEACQ